MKTALKLAAGAGVALFAALPAWAQDAAAAAAPTPDKGDTAWMMMSTVLVMAMIVPGLALFYGGLVRTKNMASVLTQVLAVAAFAMLLWVMYGYALSFGGDANQFISTGKFLLAGVTADSTVATFTDGVVIPEFVFIAFQMTFSAITVALVIGGLVERMKFSALMVFAAIWLTIVYYPIAHMVWYLGGTEAVKVHLLVKSDWTRKPIYNVIATLKGAKYPDQWIVRGNHHDGWVFGAQDPLSGSVAMLSEAKALGGLLKTGWRPDRTIVYASWDGEEPGLLGSTEWVETHAAELKAKALIYINTDSNGRGFLSAQGSHDFQHLVSDVGRDVIDPQTGRPVLERLLKGIRADAFGGQSFPPDLLASAEAGGDLQMGALGSGSDYSAFLQHIGLPALNIGYGGEDQGDGVYHSIYDSYHHMTTFDDPGLVYGTVLSKTVGRLVLRMADADTPPQRFGDFATTVAGYLAEVKKLAADRRESDEKRVKLIEAGAFGLASDPLDPVAPPPLVQMTPVIDFGALDTAIDRLKASASAFDAAFATKGASLTPVTRQKLNALLATIDQLLIDDRGLPGRPWFRNLIYAPGRFTGYGAKTLPGVREAIEERRFADAMEYARRTGAVIDAYATRLDAARALIQ